MKVTIDYTYLPTPEELASEFCSWPSDRQAKFFNHLAELAVHDIDHQLAWIVDESSSLTPAGREVMRKIGSYAE